MKVVEVIGGGEFDALEITRYKRHVAGKTKEYLIHH